MIRRSLTTILCGVFVAMGTAVVVTQPVASAATCADVEVVFARGTAEPAAPLGLTGTSFVEALRSQLPGRSVRAYGVDYPASAAFGDRAAFTRTVIDGIDDTENRVRIVARTCPRTRIVIGGYSQGAVVVGYATSSGITLPAAYTRFADQVPAPLSAEVSQRVASVVLFAPPSARFLRDAGAPAITVGPSFRSSTQRYCIPGDTVCDGAPLMAPNALHVLYSVNGDTLTAARRVVAAL